MLYYPIRTLVDAGVTDILVISGSDHLGDITQLLGSGKNFGAEFTFRVQDEALGIAHAMSLGEDFASGKSVAVILGDSIFQDNFAASVQSFQRGARIFLKEVPDPERYGVATLDGQKVLKITEKPKDPESNYAQTGLYLYDSRVFDIIRTLSPSSRGEYEVTDINNWYIQRGEMDAVFLSGYWTDAGTVASLYHASELVRGVRG